MATGKGGIRVPRGLTAEARRCWKRLHGEYDIADAGGLLTLEAAMRSFDRAEMARAVLDRDGCTTVDSRGRPKMHPAGAIETDSRAAMLSALKALNLDVAPKAAPGRPPGRY